MSLNAYGMYISDIAPQQTVVPDATGGGGGGGGSVLTNAGSPEGVITADATGTTTSLVWDEINKVLYVKDAGSGPTGWQNLVGI